MCKQLLFTFGLFLCIQQIFAQNMVFSSANQLDQGTIIKLASDKEGNLYYYGDFNSSFDADFGAGTSTLSPNGGTDLFILKYDSSNQFLWGISIGGTADDYAEGLSIDSSSNLILTGSFSGTVDFDPSANTANFTATANDIFILKLDKDGNYIWTKTTSGTGDLQTRDLEIGPNNEIYFSGIFTQTADLDPSAATYNLTSLYDYDSYFTKLDSNGNFLWAKHFGCLWFATFPEIEVSHTGDVYFSSVAQDTAFVDVLGLNQIYPIAPNFSSTVFSKFDANGNHLFTKVFEANNPQQNSTHATIKIALDDDENLYLGGVYFGTIDFNPDTTISLIDNNTGDSKLFLSKFDSSGNLIWNKTAGTPGLDQLSNMLVFNDQLIVTATWDFSYPLDLGGLIIPQNTTTGDLLWAVDKNSAATNWGLSTNFVVDQIEVTSNDDLFYAGQFSGTIDADPGASVFNLTAIQASDLAIVRLSPISCTAQNATYDSLNIVSCDTFTSPSGNYIWTTAGTYQDTISNYIGCDSILTITLSFETIDTSITQNGATLIANEQDPSVTYQWIDCFTGLDVVGAVDSVFNAPTNGSYTVVISKNGCSRTATCYFVDLCPSFEVSYSLSQDPQDSFQVDIIPQILGSDPSNQLYFFWDFGDGSIYNVSGSSTPPSHSYTSFGTFTICLSAIDSTIGGCQDVFCDTITMDSLGGLTNRSQGFTFNVQSPVFGVYNAVEQQASTPDLQLELYPNPNKGQFNIQLNGIIEEECQLDVVAVDGRILKREICYLEAGTAQQLDFRDLPKGVYYLRLRSSTKLITKAFVIQ
jgi:hypothetical protein